MTETDVVHVEDSNADEAEDVTEYELARSRNIEMNKEILRSLGLQNIAKPKRVQAPRKRKSDNDSSQPSAPLTSRRSERFVGREPANYSLRFLTNRTYDSPAESEDLPSRRSGRLVGKQIQYNKDSSESEQEDDNSPKRQRLDSNSTKVLNALIERFDEQFLGKFIPPIGGQVKAAVMQTAVDNLKPKFNKYSGIIEWANCIFLCINIGGSEYRNVFLEQGEQMTWFAPASLKEESPSLQRLMKSADPVLLFCRPIGKPYVYFGRVSYLKHDVASSPICFWLQLINKSQIIAGENGKLITDMISNDLSIVPSILKVKTNKVDGSDSDEFQLMSSEQSSQ